MMGGVAEHAARWNDGRAIMAEEPASFAEEPAPFEELFDAERDRLFRTMCVITGSRQEAEDLSQEAFARVWERWDWLDDHTLLIDV